MNSKVAPISSAWVSLYITIYCYSICFFILQPNVMYGSHNMFIIRKKWITNNNVSNWIRGIIDVPARGDNWNAMRWCYTTVCCHHPIDFGSITWLFPVIAFAAGEWLVLIDSCKVIALHVSPRNILRDNDRHPWLIRWGRCYYGRYLIILLVNDIMYVKSGTFFRISWCL